MVHPIYSISLIISMMLLEDCLLPTNKPRNFLTIITPYISDKFGIYVVCVFPGHILAMSGLLPKIISSPSPNPAPGQLVQGSGV